MNIVSTVISIAAPRSAPLAGGFLDPATASDDRVDISRAILESNSWDGAGPLFLALGLMLTGAAVLYALWLYRNRRSHPLPQLTFHRLCRGLGLSLGQQLQLWWIGRSRRLPTPITLLLCPATFDHHVRAYLARFPSDTSASPTRGRLRLIRQRLFPGDNDLDQA